MRILCSILLLTLVACNGGRDQTLSFTSQSEQMSEDGIIRQSVQPADTGAGISAEASERDYHYIASPEDVTARQNKLMLVLGGSGMSPEEFFDITDFAAGLGLSTVNLRYINYSGDGIQATDTAGVSCFGQDACFAELRGETIFGQNVTYADGMTPYDSDKREIDAANSIIGRFVSLLDYLIHQSPSAENPNPEFWSSFLIRDERSPYVVPYLGNVYPDWSKIIITGHAQGGGHAALMAMNISSENPALQVIMLSAPGDFTATTAPASWITQPSATPMNRFWGLTHKRDMLGIFNRRNWDAMGGPESGGVGGPENNAFVDVGDGSGDPMGAQRLVLSSVVRDPHYGRHEVTIDGTRPGIRMAWDYLFTRTGAE